MAFTRAAAGFALGAIVSSTKSTLSPGPMYGICTRRGSVPASALVPTRVPARSRRSIAIFASTTARVGLGFETRTMTAVELSRRSTSSFKGETGSDWPGVRRTDSVGVGFVDVDT